MPLRTVRIPGGESVRPNCSGSMKSAVYVLVAVALAGCEHKLLYSVSVENYGELGVILRNFPTRLDGLANIHAGIPGVRADIYEKSYFRGHPDSVPSEVEVVWQLAELEDCAGVREAKSYAPGADPSERYTRKLGCTFVPIEGKVFRKVVDLKEIMRTEAGQRAGKRAKPWWALSRARYGLSIAFEFRDEELEVRALTYRTNPWR